MTVFFGAAVEDWMKNLEEHIKEQQEQWMLCCDLLF
jgi:hypothetical protein